jgi:hypothetical protein
MTPRDGTPCNICGQPVPGPGEFLCGQCAEWQGIADAADAAIQFNEQRADRVAPEQRFPCRLPRRFTTGTQKGSAVKAIETEYKGYRFRSRLEARWAVFFDALPLRWEYEPEGFVTSDGTRYLPDFWLPEIRTLAEIKPLPLQFNGQPWITENTKEHAFAKDVYGFDMNDQPVVFDHPYTGAAFVVIYGTPGPIDDPYSGKGSYAASIGCDSPYLLCECALCGALGFQFDGRDGRNEHRAGCPANEPGRGDKGSYNYDSPRILRAAEIARAARFEHGEKGRAA